MSQQILFREIGNSAALRPFTKGDVMPVNLKGVALEKLCDQSSQLSDNVVDHLLDPGKKRSKCLIRVVW
jgi:hypothetical protein